MTATAEMTMEELLAAYPGAQRALFRNFHIGGCSSCGFRPDETVAEVCARNGGLAPETVLGAVLDNHAQEEALMVSPADVSTGVAAGRIKLVDIRTREEYDAVRIEGSHLFSQGLIQEIFNTWPKEQEIAIVDHTGVRAPDAAAYLVGHGYTKVGILRGGIDAWSCEVDPSLPRYTIE